MIRTRRTHTPSEHIKTRSETMSGRTLRPGEFRIVPSEAGKAVRIVRFHLDDDDVAIDCYEEETGISCKANSFNHHCSHVEKAIQLLLQETS